MSSDSLTAVEEWRPVVGYEGLYSVSNLGRIKSHHTRLLYGPLQPGGHYRALCQDRRGYLRVGLSRNRKQIGFPVHRLVMLAFIGPEPGRPWVNHKNGNPKDNRLNNLEWCTSSENQQHRYDVLKRGACQGSKHGMAKLTESQVLEIRRRLSMGEMVRSLARIFNIGEATVSVIKHRKTWTHI